MKTVQQNYISYTQFPSKVEDDEKTCESEEKKSHRLGLETFLLEAVDETLSSLGDSAKQAIYFHLEKSFKIKKLEIPNKIEEFALAIEKIFGDGAKLLEIQTMKRLHQKVGQDLRKYPRNDELLFTEYMRARAQ